MEKLANVWNAFTGSSPAGIVAWCLCVIAFAFLYFWIIKFLLDIQSNWMAVLFVSTMVVGGIIVSGIEKIDGVAYLFIPIVFLVVILDLYSVDVKRIIWTRKQLKLSEIKHGESRSYDEERVNTCINEIIKALQNMSKNDVGAIIVLSTDNVPGQIIESGVKLDSDISSALIESVFFPKTPLHDGAMIINDMRIVAAGCFLPLSQKESIPKDLGTRHRAGIGVTETLDVMSLIVSEETGVISIAKAGKITRYADYDMLKKTLTQYYWQELESSRR